MYSTDDLFRILREIEALIRENIKPDGTANFDTYRVMVSLELSRRMILREENSDNSVDGETQA